MADKIVNFSDARRELDKGDPPHVIAELGGPIDETGVALCIYGEDLIPDEVSELLGLNPTHAHRKGDRKKPSSRHPFKIGAWILEIRGETPKEPEDLTAALLDQLPQAKFVWTELASRYRVELRYGLHMVSWNRGLHLSHGIVERIAKTQAKVGFDIYAHLEYEDE